MFYREARDVAAAAGDVPTAFDAADRLADEFPVHKLHERLAVLEAAVPTLNSAPANAAVTSMCLDLADQCVAVDDDYDRATSFLALAAQTAAKSERRAFASWVRWKHEQIASLRVAYERARPAAATLKRSPDDPHANLTMGRYVCLTRKDWDSGLAMLANGSDRELAELASRDLDCPDGRTTPQFALAEAWWHHAESQLREHRSGYRSRAAFWYRRALPELDGLDRATAQRRVAEATSTNSFAIARKPARIPRPPDAMPFNKHLYRLHIAEVPWETARRLCEEAGGRLVCLETRLENDYVIKLARGRVAWLGAQRDARGRWSWINDAEMFFSYWAHEQPNIADAGARPQLGPSGAWRTSGAPSGFACEWDD
jgi:hypothetical protein